MKNFLQTVDIVSFEPFTAFGRPSIHGIKDEDKQRFVQLIRGQCEEYFRKMRLAEPTLDIANMHARVQPYDKLTSPVVQLDKTTINRVLQSYGESLRYD